MPSFPKTTRFVRCSGKLFLDSIMHPDVQPFQPWSSYNPSFGIIGLFALHGLCVLLGVAGGLYVAYQATK
jgi:hypothetical protein